MICPSCSHENFVGVEVCAECGQSFGSEDRVICPSCSHDNISGVEDCEECGQSLSEAYQDWGSEEFKEVFTEPLSALNLQELVCVSPTTSLAEVISLLKERHVGCVLVTGEGGQLIGICTERDILYRVAGLISDLAQIAVESLMTPRPTALRADAAVQHALHLMSIHGFRHVPLVDDDDRPVGLVSFKYIVRFIEENFSPTA